MLLDLPAVYTIYRLTLKSSHGELINLSMPFNSQKQN